MPLQWQEHPPLAEEFDATRLNILSSDYPAQRLVQLLEQIANDNDVTMSEYNDPRLKGWFEGRSCAFRLAAEWIRKDLIRDVSK